MDSHFPNSAVNHWYNVPAIKRKEYEKIARISRNELEHERTHPKKGAFVPTAKDSP